MSGERRDDLTCRELVELVTEYLEGTLQPLERDRFEAHLEGCSKCGAYLDQMRATLAAARRLSERSLPRGARVALLRAFRGWKGRRPGTA